MAAVAIPPSLFGPELAVGELVGTDLGHVVDPATLQAEIEADVLANPSRERQSRRSRPNSGTNQGIIGVGRTNTSRTVADAVESMRTLMLQQIQSAGEQGTKPNEVAEGDSAVRVVFYTVLPYAQQRSLFLEIAQNPRAWPRLRGLFGAPPYQFLGAEDAWALRAAGIARGRTHMGYEDKQAAANYSQFGSGHYADIYEREYRVLPRLNADVTDPLPWMLQELGTSDLRLEVRVKKRDRKRKLELLKDKDGRVMLTFPRPGDHIQLTETPRMLSIQNKRAVDAAKPLLKVKRVFPRGDHAATAAVLGTVI